MRHHRKNAFTLIELLVVIAIIAVLAALLLPSLAAAKSRGRSTVCKNNLRQHGVALQLYVGDHSHFPPADASNNSPYPGDLSAHRFIMSLSAYFPAKSDVTVCPERVEVSTKWQLGGLATTNTTFRASYGYNTRGTSPRAELQLGLGGWGQQFHPTLPLREAAVVHPADMIAIGDILHFYGFPMGIYWGSRPSLRHSGGSNMVLCDGHVEYAKHTVWVGQADHQARRWNNDNLPHQEIGGKIIQF